MVRWLKRGSFEGVGEGGAASVPLPLAPAEEATVGASESRRCVVDGESGAGETWTVGMGGASEGGCGGSMALRSVADCS